MGKAMGWGKEGWDSELIGAVRAGVRVGAWNRKAMEEGLGAAGWWDFLTQGHLTEHQAEWAATAALQRAGSWARGRVVGQQARAGTGFISLLTTVAAPGHVVGSVKLNQLDKESGEESRRMGWGAATPGLYLNFSQHLKH